MMHQSPSTFGHQYQAPGAKKQKPSPPPRYHDLVENSEMGIIISPNNPRDSAPAKTRDVEVKTEFQPRSVTMKLMSIIFALIIISTFAGTLYSIVRLNQFEIMINSKIREIKTIIQLKQELTEDLIHRESFEEDGFSLLDTRLRLIDLRLQDLIDSHEEMMKEDFSCDAEEEGKYSDDELRADNNENEQQAENVEYSGFEEDYSEITNEDLSTGNLDQDEVIEDDDSEKTDENNTARNHDQVIEDDDTDSEVTDEDRTKRNLDQDQAISLEPKDTTSTNDEDILLDYEDEVTSGLE